MVSIEKILNSKEFVLVDTCMHHLPTTKSDFCVDLFTVSCYESLELDKIQDQIEAYKEFIKMISHPSAVQIPEVTEELRKYSEIIGVKLGYLSEKYSKNHKNTYSRSLSYPKRRTHKKNKRISQWNTERKKELEELQKLSFSAYKLSKSKYPDFIENPRYNILVKMVKEISFTLNLKGCDFLKYDGSEKNPYLSDTDEKITAAIFMAAITGIRNPAVLTNDSDLLYLLGVIPKIIGAYDFSGNESFREAIIHNPYQLYLPNYGKNKEYKPALTDLEKGLIFNTEFNIHGKKEVRERIQELWDLYNQSENKTSAA